MHICVAYTYDEAPALELKKELEELYPGENIICDPLSLSVSCHIGPHSLAIAICKNLRFSFENLFIFGYNNLTFSF